jgi:Family of unknown function (DUF5681)
VSNSEISVRDQTTTDPYPWRFKKGQSGNPAGKPKGLAITKTAAIANKCAATGRTPLETLINLMNKAFSAGERSSGEKRWRRFDDAARWAAMAAPYMHSRMPTLVHVGGETKIEISWQPVRDN